MFKMWYVNIIILSPFFKFVFIFYFYNYWESLDEELLLSVDITSTSSATSLEWFLVSMTPLLTPMCISPVECQANWFCWEAWRSKN